ncbi:MAG: Alpha-2-macroglobulin domain protein, partial [Patescibacteria group bacterium]|nr:Alpha-2-macroglobulin domain protein [Patescibacteria group bacterium]
AAIANKKQGFANSNVEESAIYNLARIMEHQVGWSGRRNDERSKEYSIFSPTVWSVYALQSLESSAVDVGVALEYVFRNNVYESEIKAIQALTTVTYYLNTQQLSPNYQYVVKAGSQTVASGTVNSAQQDIAPIFIPADVIQSGQAITIEKSGNGKLFSQLDVNQFYPARNLEAQQHNLTLTRKYLGTKPAGEPVMPGDLVIVEFTVGGLGLGETSVQIEDYLPSNLMAIDESLDNGNFDAGPNDAIENKPSSQITDQGMKLTFQNLTTDGKYSYKTRVVSQGSFDTPPAVVKLVKQPALWAASDSYKFIVDGKVSLDTVGSGGYATNKPSLIQNKPILAIVAGTVIAVASILAIIFRNKLRNVLLRFRHGTPPDSPPPPQPPIV